MSKLLKNQSINWILNTHCSIFRKISLKYENKYSKKTSFDLFLQKQKYDLLISSNAFLK